MLTLERIKDTSKVHSLSRSCGGGLGWGCPTRIPVRVARARTRRALRAPRPPPQAGEAKYPTLQQCSITSRRGDGVQAAIAEHMGHEARSLEYFSERRIADIQATGVGAERRHNGALAVAGETTPLH
jgi:hypothetical protein